MLVAGSITLSFAAGVAGRVLQLVPGGSAWLNALAAVVFITFGYLGVMAGAAMARFLFLLFPLRANGAPRIGCMVLVGVAACLGCAIFGTALIERLTEIAGRRGDADIPVSLNAVIYSFPLAFVLTLARATWWRYMPSYGKTGHRTVLYLRRFARFADRELTGVLYRATPPDCKVVSLVTPRRRVVTWDPTVVCIAGLSPTRPVASAPIFLIAADDEWRDNVTALAVAASVIVIDASEWSEAVALEAEIVVSKGLLSKTVWLVASDSGPGIDRLSRPGVPAWEIRRVRYDKSWRAALPRLAAFGMFLIASGIALRAGQRSWFGVNPLTGSAAFFGALLPWGALLFLAVYYGRIFIRLGVDRNLHEQIRATIREITATG